MEPANARSLGGAYGSNVGQSAGIENGAFYDGMEALPPASLMVAWNMNRVSNTVIKNKSARGARNAGGIRQTFSPFRFGSLANVENIDPLASGWENSRKTRRGRVVPGPTTGSTGIPSRTSALRAKMASKKAVKNASSIYKTEPIRKLVTRDSRAASASAVSARAGRKRVSATKAGYSPFNVLSRGGNAMLRDGTRSNTVLSKMGGGAIYSKLGIDGPLSGNQHAFAPGTLGRISAAGRAGAMGGTSAAKQANILSSVSRMGGASRNLGGSGIADRARIISSQVNGETGQALKSAVGATNTGQVSGKMTGFIHGMEAKGSKALDAAKFVGGSNSAYTSGVTKGAAFASKGGVLAKVGASGVVSGAARAAGPIGYILLAHDLAKFAGKMTGRAINTAIEGGQSAMGDLNKNGPFGMGFQDNSVAATSRARGVMAISNSRLNARSVLGNEASYMHGMMG
jgi:hypothetical protein